MNGWPAPSFDGSNDFMSAGALSNFVSASAYHGFAVFRPTVLLAQSGTVWTDPIVLGDFSTYLGLTATTSGVQAFHYTSVYNATPVGQPLIAGTRYIVEWSYDGTTIRCRLNAGATMSVACGNISLLTGTTQIGHGYTTSAYLTGPIGSIIVCNQYLGSGEAGAVRNYLSSKYGVPV